ncbi:MAG: hypothetical protein GC158_10260 [Cyanobacteria bacterium RI_101]|nr:hypothetical protein [Cyanobacteria bacterium RI_101]
MLTLPITKDQLLLLIDQLSTTEKQEILQYLGQTHPEVLDPKENSSEQLTEDALNMVAVFERLTQNAQAKGLTEEILEELLADES